MSTKHIVAQRLALAVGTILAGLVALFSFLMNQ